MAAPQISTKRLAISKANAQMVAVVGIASFVTVFCLVASQAVWSQTRYQARVTSAEEKAHKQLQDNLAASDQLVDSYKNFTSSSTNVIGGHSSGTADNDGNNAKIVLDALPSAYDFPAVTSSIEKILNTGNFHISNVSGTDDQLNQQNNTSSPTPQPVNMPFSFSVTGANYNAVQQLIATLQKSIRPIQIDTINLTGSANNLTVTVNAHTYYQPGQSVNITKQVVK